MLDFRNLYDFLSTAIALFFSIIIHEVAHAFVANLYGDTTAKERGRISLNPLRHLDPIGVISLLFFGFGWAKPVPINSHNFTNEKMGIFAVSLAGVATNLVSALLAIFLIQFIPDQFTFVWETLLKIAYFGISLCIFNLIPLPPLDGSHVLLLFLPFQVKEWIYTHYRKLQFLLMFLVFSGLISRLISPIIQAIYKGFIRFVFG